MARRSAKVAVDPDPSERPPEVEAAPPPQPSEDREARAEPALVLADAIREHATAVRELSAALTRPSSPTTPSDAPQNRILGGLGSSTSSMLEFIRAKSGQEPSAAEAPSGNLAELLCGDLPQSIVGGAGDVAFKARLAPQPINILAALRVCFPDPAMNTDTPLTKYTAGNPAAITSVVMGRVNTCPIFQQAGVQLRVNDCTYLFYVQNLIDKIACIRSGLC